MPAKSTRSLLFSCLAILAACGAAPTGGGGGGSTPTDVVADGAGKADTGAKSDAKDIAVVGDEGVIEVSVIGDAASDQVSDVENNPAVACLKAKCFANFTACHFDAICQSIVVCAQNCDTDVACAQNCFAPVTIALGKQAADLRTCGINQKCLPGSNAVCGDGKCEPPETASACPADCGSADAKSDGDSGSGDKNKICCDNAGATCGFVNGCSASCGQCTGGKKCDVGTHQCVASSGKTTLGNACGPSATCPFPKLQSQVQAYLVCINAQCDSNFCFIGMGIFDQGVCSVKDCTKTDNINNATGKPGPDGIEDAGPSVDCGGAADGPAGSKFRCVDTPGPQFAPPVPICMPGTDFKPCKANSDCPADEACGFAGIFGQYSTHCIAKYKNAAGKAGSATGQICNNGSSANQPLSICSNNFCQGQCTGFCKTDTDCVSTPGACAAGKCAGSGASCGGDADCSGQYCAQNQQLFTDVVETFGICKGKKCTLDSDCGDSNFYCNPTYNQVMNPKGDPDPTNPTVVKMPAMENTCARKLAGGVKKGLACDPFPNNSSNTLKQCENASLCQSGFCSNVCTQDADCAVGMRCGAQSYPFNTQPQANPPAYTVEAATGICVPDAGLTTECLGDAMCKNSQICRAWKYTADIADGKGGKVAGVGNDGMCINDAVALLPAGSQCGPDAGDGLCKSDMCLLYFNYPAGDGTQAQIGNCFSLCDGQAACGDGVMIDLGKGQLQKFPTICDSVWNQYSGLADVLNRTYIPICRPINPGSSLADCAVTKKCTDKTEFCRPQTVSLGPDKANIKVEYRCLKLPTDANKNLTETKKVGEACTISADPNAPLECLSTICAYETAKTGYCSGMCNSDSDCGNGTVCDLKHQQIARKDVTKAGIVPQCLKKKSCVPCNYDFHCHSDYKCTTLNVGDPYGHCAPGCNSNADCVGKDGGSQCVPAKDATGAVVVGAKVCAPAVCN